MKYVFLLSVLLSPTAFAVELGEQIQIPRSQIQCQDRIKRPSKPCHYCYDDFLPVSNVTIDLAIGGIQKFSGASNYYSCAELAQIQGDPALAEVVQITERKIGDHVFRSIQLTLPGLTVVGRSN